MMKQNIRKWMGVLFFLAVFAGVVFGVLPGTGVTAEAKTIDFEDLQPGYVEDDGKTIIAKNGDVLTGELGSTYILKIAAPDDNNPTVTVTLSGVKIAPGTSSSTACPGIECLGNATILLKGDNTVKGTYTGNKIAYPGIIVAPGSTLIINQVESGGTLNVTGGGLKQTGPGGTRERYAAAIGGGCDKDNPDNLKCGNIIINGGTIIADNTPNNRYAAAIGGGFTGSCGDITINGGNVTATSSYNAGIGGGKNETASCGNITITGGTVTARGYTGIGGGVDEGANCGNITISGGEVTATGTSFTGIGAGTRGNCGNISISEGTITATGAYTGIGGGGYETATCGKITISGGIVTAKSTADNATNGAGIGGGGSNAQSSVSGACGDIEITGGTVYATAEGRNAAGIGCGKSSSCGNITITDGVTKVVATKGSPSKDSIGSSSGRSCSSVTIGDIKYWDGNNYLNGGDTYLTRKVLVYPEPKLTIEAPTFNDAYVDYEERVAKAIKITNDGSGDAVIKTIELVPNDGNFILNTTDGKTIASGATDETYTIHPKKGLPVRKDPDNQSVIPYEAAIKITCEDGTVTTADVSFKVKPAPINISSVAVAGVTDPVAGETLDTDASTTTSNVSLSTVSWNPADTTAESATKYTASVIVTPADGYGFNSSTTATFNGKNVTPDLNEDGTLTVSYTFPGSVTKPVIPSAVYTGSPQTATVPESTLYTVTTNDGGTIVGDYDVVLTLTDSDNYQWSTTIEAAVTLTFSITKASNSISNLQITGWAYQGTPNLPSATASFGTPTFKYCGSDGVYSDTVPSTVGTWYVKAYVAGTDNYDAAESDPVSFEITAIEDPGVIASSAEVFRGGTLALTDFVTDNIGDVTLTITDSDAKGCSISGTTFTAGDTPCTLSVSVSIAATDNTTAKSGTVVVTVKDKTARALNVSMAGTPYVYGTDIPDPTHDAPTTGLTIGPVITYTGREETTYGPSTVKPADIGDYTVTVTAEDSTTAYSGSADFSITAKSISGATVTVSGDYPYTGNPIVPESGNVSVVLGGGMLTYETDYTYTASDNVDIGVNTATVTVTGTGNYTGTTTGKFTIRKQDNPATFVLTGAVKKGGNTLDLSEKVTLNGATGNVVFAFATGTDTLGCSLVGSTLTSGTETGTVSVTVTVGEDDIHLASDTKTISITITDKDAQDLAFASDSLEKAYGDAPFTNELSGAQTTVTYSIVTNPDTGVASIDENSGEVTILGVGTATVTATAAETLDYASATASYSVTIGKSAITITADNKTMVYGETEPDLTATITGTVGETKPVYTLSRDEGSTVGTYEIKVLVGEGNEYYNITPVNGTFTISEASKEDLDKAITEAEEYYEEIKDQYPTIAEELKKAINEAKQTASNPNVTAEEIAEELQKLKDEVGKAEEDVKKQDDQEAADKVKDLIDALPKAEDVTLDDEDAITEAQKAYDELTDDQKKLIDEETLKKLTDAEEALEALKDKEKKDQEAADKVKDLIDALPKPEDVKQTDAEAIEAARKAYDALTEDQKKLISAETLKHLTDAEEALKGKTVTYVAYEGEGGEYTKGSDGTLTFVFKRSEEDESTFDHFFGVTYNGEPLVRDKHYTAKAGSVIITLDHDFLEGLETGEHTITAVFDDGLADAHFTVISKAEPTPTPKPKPVPKTGDSAPLGLWLGLILVGLIGLGTFIALRRRTQKK